MLHPQRADDLGLAGPVYLAEISTDALVAAAPSKVSYRSLPRLPGTRRDVAILADRSLSAEAVRSFLAREAGGDLGAEVIERVYLFDVYRGETIDPSKVSLAFAIEYRHPERTLTDQEVNRAFEEVLGRLQKELGVEIRD
jgi:phenylalanyl-tRNA synthetase beta chain